MGINVPQGIFTFLGVTVRHIEIWLCSLVGGRITIRPKITPHTRAIRESPLRCYHKTAYQLEFGGDAPAGNSLQTAAVNRLSSRPVAISRSAHGIRQIEICRLGCFNTAMFLKHLNCFFCIFIIHTKLNCFLIHKIHTDSKVTLRGIISFYYFSKDGIRTSTYLRKKHTLYYHLFFKSYIPC